MDAWLEIPILPQPSDTTCGPTCLQAVYAYYGHPLELARVIEEVPSLQEGGTLAVLLGTDALRRGFEATILTYNLVVFDPTWFEAGAGDLREKLHRQWEVKSDPKLREAIEAYIRFLDLGGRIRFEDLTPAVLRRYLKRRIPILTGLSATYLYRSSREKFVGERLRYDDVRGEPQGHFVVLCGYDAKTRAVGLADPLGPNPLGAAQIYTVDMNRLLNAVLLGVVTYDANLLVIQPHVNSARGPYAHPPGGRQP